MKKYWIETKSNMQRIVSIKQTTMMSSLVVEEAMAATTTTTSADGRRWEEGIQPKTKKAKDVKTNESGSMNLINIS